MHVDFDTQLLKEPWRETRLGVGQAIPSEAWFAISFFWAKGQMKVKSLVFGWKVCVMQQRTERADILLRKGGKYIIRLTGRFQMEVILCSPRFWMCPLEAVGVHSLCCMGRYVHCALSAFISKGSLRGEVKNVTRWEHFAFLWLDSGTCDFWLQPKDLLLALAGPCWVAGNEKRCFT